MKSILISIRPKYVADILNGRKTIEIRKSYPKCGLPIDVYIYCTKDNKQRLYPVSLLDKSNQVFKRAYREDKIDNRTNYLNGKVVAKFTLNKVEEIKNNLAMRFFTESANEKELLEKSCLNSDQLFWYLASQELKVKCCGYAWHIDNLVIFDKPKELSEFRPSYQGKCLTSKCKYCDECGYCDVECRDERLTKAPQSFCYVEVKQDEIH